MSSPRTPPKSRLPSNPPPPKPPPKRSSAFKAESTNVWGLLETKNFLKVPNVVFRLARYDAVTCKNLKPRHLLLILVLAHRKFKDKPIQAYWIELAQDLGVSAEAVRKWGYQLREMGLLKIRQNRGRCRKANKPGIRNERNTFDIEPFVRCVTRADNRWQAEKEDRRARKS